MKIYYLENQNKELPWYYGYSHADNTGDFIAYWYPVPINKITGFFVELWYRLKYNRAYFQYTFSGMHNEVLSLEKQIENLSEKVQKNDLKKSQTATSEWHTKTE
jgi:hypothetical protein